MAAVTAVLSRYPRDVIKNVTHPATGLPVKSDFLPTVKEVFDACEGLMQSRREQEARKKRIEQQFAERAEFEKRHPVFAKDSDGAKAVRLLHDLVGRTSAFFQIFRRSDGSVTYTKEMTPQLLALAQAPQDQESWPVLNRQHAGAWEELLRKVFDQGLVRTYLTEGSRAPWPWPPSIEGKIYSDADGVPPINDEDRNALAAEGQAR